MADHRTLITHLCDELDHNRRMLLDDRQVTHPLADRARAALVADGPAVPEGREPASVTGEPSDAELLELWKGWNLGWDPQRGTVLMPHPAEYARAVLARWGRPAPVPVASNTRYEFSVLDEDYTEQAGGTAPSYAQALSEGQHYLAQYQQDGPHTLEVRRVEVLPLPSGEDRP